MKLPEATWGMGIAGLIQGLTLILLALGVLLTAFGRLDDSLSKTQRDDLLQGFIWLGLVEPQASEPELVSQSVTVNSAHGPDNATASLTVPNDVDIRSYASVFDGKPVNGARFVGAVAADPASFGTVIVSQKGNAPAPDNGATAGAEFHVSAIVVKKHGVLSLTPLGKVVFCAVFLVGVSSITLGFVKKRRKAAA